MPIVAAQGLGFHVQELGAGPPVVMLHGLLVGSLASWYLTAAPVLARDHRVRVFDLRGHGRSERARTGYDVRTMAGDLAALAADLDEPFDLVGHSWGGLVALRFALDHPGRVRRLAIVEAPLPPSRMTELTAFLTDGDGRQRLFDALAPLVCEAMNSGGRQTKRMRDSFGFLIRESSLLADLCAERDFANAELAHVACPTLLLYGDRSPCAPTGDRLARVLPEGRLIVLPGGHYLHVEARAQVAGALAEFLGERDPRRRIDG